MIGFFDRLSRPLMRALDPEDAHALAIKALALYAAAAAGGRCRANWRCAPSGSISPIRSVWPPASTRTRRCRTRCCGSVSASSRSARVTPLPQAGNPRPRLFRLEADEGVINRLGFNNEGAAAVLARLAARAERGRHRRRQYRRQPRQRRPRRRLRAADRNLRRRSPAISPSTSPRPTRRACATCSRPRRSTICSRACSMRANGCARAPGRRRCCSRSRPISRSPISTTWSASRASTASTA